jgi:hypothetical protein
MNRAALLLSLDIIFGALIIPTNGTNPEFIETQRIKDKLQQDYVDDVMRKAGTCRWWLLVYNLPDRAYSKPEQRPDAKFRQDMNRRCPETLPEFVGPQDKDYFEDRKRWNNKFGKYKEWRRL